MNESISLKKHLNDLQAKLNDALTQAGISACVDDKEQPQNLSQEESAFLRICREKYEQEKEKTSSYDLTPLYFKVTDNNKKELEKSFDTLNMSLQKSNARQFVGYFIVFLTLGLSFRSKTFKRYFFTNQELIKSTNDTRKALETWEQEATKITQKCSKLYQSINAKTASNALQDKDEIVNMLQSIQQWHGDKDTITRAAHRQGLLHTLFNSQNIDIIKAYVTTQSLSAEEIKIALKGSFRDTANVELLDFYLDQVYEKESPDWIYTEISSWMKQASSKINLEKLIKLESLANKYNLNIKALFNDIDKNKLEPQTREKLDHFLTSPNIDHTMLIKCGQKLGYSLSDEGVCYGYTMRWIEASLLGQQKRFLNRNNKISELYRCLSEPEIRFEDLEQQPEWQSALWDIKAFYESLLLYQEEEISRAILEKPVNQDDIEIVSAIASSDVIQARGGIKKTATLQYAKCTQDQLSKLLTEIKSKVDHTGYQLPVCLLLFCFNEELGFHAINITYNPGSPRWEWMDINGVSHTNDNLKDFLNKICLEASVNGRLYWGERYQYFSLSTILLKQGSESLETELLQLRESVPDEKTYTLLDASRQGDIVFVNRILAQDGLSIINQTQKNNFAPLCMAAQNGHSQVVEALLKSGADSNQPNKNGNTPLISATFNGHMNVIEALLENGADPNKVREDGISPLFIAVQNGHDKIVERLLKCPTIRIDDPIISSTETLKKFARSRGDAIIQRMNECIEQKIASGEDQVAIHLLPAEIAHIMGHHHIAEMIESHQMTQSRRPGIDSTQTFRNSIHTGRTEIGERIKSSGP